MKFYFAIDKCRPFYKEMQIAMLEKGDSNTPSAWILIIKFINGFQIHISIPV